MRHLLPLLLALAACSSDPAPPADSGPADTGPLDTGPLDVGPARCTPGLSTTCSCGALGTSTYVCPPSGLAPAVCPCVDVDASATDVPEDRPAPVDAGALDASQVDAGADAGGDDAGQLDAGTDAGAPGPFDAAEDRPDAVDAGADVPTDRPDVVDVMAADASDASFCADGGLMCRSQCVDYRRDPDNCGACGARCLRPGSPFTGTTGATTGCENGMCANVVCVAGRANCDGDGTNGCETDLQTPANCGSCGRRCRSCDLGFCIL